MLFGCPHFKVVETPLSSYLEERFGYRGEYLKYMPSFSSDSYTISQPGDLKYRNSKNVNGYPYFEVPVSIISDEISWFLEAHSLFDNCFIFRYGDTHPHKIIPKLAQCRNIALAEMLYSLTLAKEPSRKLVYLIGDISKKTINSFISALSIDVCPEQVRDFFFYGEAFSLDEAWNQYVDTSIDLLNQFLDVNGFIHPTFVRESSFYVSTNSISSSVARYGLKDGIRQDGFPTYLLQELVSFLCLLKGTNPVVFNLIGDNQAEHIKSVHQVLNEQRIADCVLLTHGVCKRGEDRIPEHWSSFLPRATKLADYMRFLALSTKPDTILDFSLNEQYLKRWSHFQESIKSVNRRSSDKVSNENQVQMLFKMGLVNYALRKSVMTGNPSVFYRFIMEIVNSGCISYTPLPPQYPHFIQKCLSILSLTLK